MNKIIFYSKYPVVLFMLFWILLVHCSSRSIVIFLIVSKEIQVRSEKILLFFRKETFLQLLFTFIAKKNRNKIFFSVDQNCKTKKFAIRTISDKYFAKYIISHTSKKFAKILWKEKFSPKKFDKKIFGKKKFFETKKLEKSFLNNFGSFFVFEKKIE